MSWPTARILTHSTEALSLCPTRPVFDRDSVPTGQNSNVYRSRLAAILKCAIPCALKARELSVFISCAHLRRAKEARQSPACIAPTPSLTLNGFRFRTPTSGVWAVESAVCACVCRKWGRCLLTAGADDRDDVSGPRAGLTRRAAHASRHRSRIDNDDVAACCALQPAHPCAAAACARAFRLGNSANNPSSQTWTPPQQRERTPHLYQCGGKKRRRPAISSTFFCCAAAPQNLKAIAAASPQKRLAIQPGAAAAPAPEEPLKLIPSTSLTPVTLPGAPTKVPRRRPT